MLPMETARAAIVAGSTLIESPFVDIAAVAPAWRSADPEAHPPEAAYVRDADAKPQDELRASRGSRHDEALDGARRTAYRAGTAGDAEALAGIHAKGFYRGWPREDSPPILAEARPPVYVACDAKRRVAGFAMIRIASDEAELLTIAVEPKWRGKSVGQALLRAAFADLMMSPAKRMFLEVDEQQCGGASGSTSKRLCPDRRSARAIIPPGRLAGHRACHGARSWVTRSASRAKGMA